MKAIRIAACASIVMSSLAGVVAHAADEPSIKTDALAAAFNAAAQANQSGKTATLERCKTGTVTTWCQYRISEQTIIVASGRKSDSLIRNVTVVTNHPKGQAKVDADHTPLTQEASAVWPTVIQIWNPELSATDREALLGKFDPVVKRYDGTAVAKAGLNYYTAEAAPDMGIWLVANLKAPAAPKGTSWMAKWRARVQGWMKH